MSKTMIGTSVKKDHPGVYVPPPIIYAVIFLAGILLQKNYPLSLSFFKSDLATISGIVFIAVTFLIVFVSIRQFVISRNTIITVKPATSLQTTGIYAISRNPMYIGLLMLYLALSFLVGNWWNFILLPLLVLIIQFMVIKKEERYLEREFGATYVEYKRKVRRWI